MITSVPFRGARAMAAGNSSPICPAACPEFSGAAWNRAGDEEDFLLPLEDLGIEH